MVVIRRLQNNKKLQHMKVLFLDHDGVICLYTEWGSRFKNKEGLDSVFDRFNPKAIKVLNEIIEATDCEIVISSDWRLIGTLAQMQELYKIRGVLKSPIDYTDVLRDDNMPVNFVWNRQWINEQTRCVEIRKWVKDHPEITNWAVVDDMNMTSDYHFKYDEWRASWGIENFVHTPISNEGIKQSGIKDKIIKILNNDLTIS